MREEDRHKKMREGNLIDRIEKLEARVAELEKGPQIDPEMVRNSALDMIREIERSTHIGGFDELKIKKTPTQSPRCL